MVMPLSRYCLSLNFNVHWQSLHFIQAIMFFFVNYYCVKRFICTRPSIVLFGFPDWNDSSDDAVE